MSRRKQRLGDGAHAPHSKGPVADGADDETPGLPGFRRWRDVYLFVFVVFVGVVVALAIFSSIYA